MKGEESGNIPDPHFPGSRRDPRVPGTQQPQQSLKKEMTLIHSEHPVLFGELQWVQVHLEAFTPQHLALPAQIGGMKPRTIPVGGTETSSILQRDFFATGRRESSKVCSFSTRFPQSPRTCVP